MMQGPKASGNNHISSRVTAVLFLLTNFTFFFVIRQCTTDVFFFVLFASLLVRVNAGEGLRPELEQFKIFLSSLEFSYYCSKNSAPFLLDELFFDLPVWVSKLLQWFSFFFGWGGDRLMLMHNS